MEKKDNVLVISFDMLPTAMNFGSVQRMHYLCEHLAKHFEILSVSSMKPNIIHHHQNYNSVQLKNFGFLHRIIYNRLYNDNSKKNEVLRTNINRMNWQERGVKKKGLIKKFFKSIEKYIYNEPNSYMGYLSNNWIKRNTNHILKIINENDVKVVIISGPPFGVFSIVPRIKNLLKISIILDYRDPWNLWNKGSFVSRNKELRYLHKADYCVFTNKVLADTMARKCSLNKDKIRIIANGYSPQLSQYQMVPLRKNSKIILSHIGDVSFMNASEFRDISSFLEGLSMLEEVTLEQIIVRIIGVKDLNLSATMIPEKLKNSIELVKEVPLEEAYYEMLLSDVLLLFHTDSESSSRYIISGKLYDYIYGRKFILSIGSEESQHSELINQLKVGIHIENNPLTIASTLELIIKEKLFNNYPEISPETIEQFSRTCQNEKYVELISSILGKGV